jgi:hypothetical protein
MNNSSDNEALNRRADMVIRSTVINLKWLGNQLLKQTEKVAQTDDDLLLERLFSSQMLILEAITKLKIASELLDIDRRLDSAPTGNPSVSSR